MVIHVYVTHHVYMHPFEDLLQGSAVCDSGDKKGGREGTQRVETMMVEELVPA